MDQDATCRDDNSPVSGGRLPYLDVQYGLPYGRTYLALSPFTYGAFGGDRHTHAGEAARLPSAPLFTYLRSSRANSRCAKRCMIVNIANSSDKSEEKKLRNKSKSTKMSTVNSIVVSLSRPPVFSLILELCLLF